eukprot:CAMPEP_0202023410 /NCGR_PEP_ID=MMETSP0905-20130828/51838_1 /ASSEMBLY_ACC=CAM_ASM_000554 /TAXON_ID=420261 /ORGANISM="Thalassiosira antarctica, Strain CCMP982" /LENGTH=48 /DNA_ID= /DNA_START= /DNA_END= /DNA_ORIENTATION=
MVYSGWGTIYNAVYSGGPSGSHDYGGVFLACVDCHLGPSLANIGKSNQ